MKVSQVMTKNVITTSPTTSAAMAFMQMIENGFRHLPIVGSDGFLWGIISMSDLRETLHLRQGERTLAMEHFESSVLTKDLVKSKPFFVTPDSDVRSAATLMVKKKIGALPVIEKSGALVGIISESDILSTFVHFMSLLKPSDEICLNLPDKKDALNTALKIFENVKTEVLGVSMSKGRKRGTKDFLFRVQSRNLQKLKESLTKKGYTVVKMS